MQQSQRAELNHALEYAVEIANHLKLPLIVLFGLTADYPEANPRHYAFMLEGLKETQAALAERGIKMVVQSGHPSSVAMSLGRKAAAIVCDRGYLRHQKHWRAEVAEKADCRVVQVESDAIVPVEQVSAKAEYAARTIRSKIRRMLNDYLIEPITDTVGHDSTTMKIWGLDISDTNKVLRSLNLNRRVLPVSRFFPGGTASAKQRFSEFLTHGLERYAQNSNQPQTDDISHMSMYLHFGQISPLYLALEVNKLPDDSEKIKEGKARYLEELIVRRELAINFVHYTPAYDAYECIPGWAKTTLKLHAEDKRDHAYSPKELESARTHDDYWNAAMKEMKHTGFMHNYMRMYWGKKILEWSKTPEQAFQTTLALNNRYFLDGRDPNSYAGVAWIYGVHDRAWAERPVFGKVRYMAASGLERKCDIRAYVDKTEVLVSLLSASHPAADNHR